MSAVTPSPTLYVRNIDEKVKTIELRAQLYALFSTYGRILDIRATKGTKMRGQAFLIFADLAGATTAMRACEGIPFYDKPLHIEYARNSSHATIRQQNPNFISPALAKNKAAASAKATGTATSSKRQREDDDATAAEREPKRERPAQPERDADDDEMEIEEEEEPKPPLANGAASASTTIQRPPSATLLVTNLPQEINEDMLSVLFQQYQGFQSVQVTQSPHPAVVAGATTNAKTKMSQVFYDSADLASTAKEALDGFTVKPGWQVVIQFV
ncbi:RNA-binding domain-containing protein [Auriculariales sp. MPI-PUGE-AT-0066]|nr:RNA-binding domain-containing protein [Auriculariales sp. MPI-PUGE-AT-0066]